MKKQVPKTMHKRILIYAEVIVPPAYNPRLRYFCMHLQKQGYTVDLVCESAQNIELLPPEINVFPIEYYRFKKGVLGKIEWLIKFGINLLSDFKGRYFYQKSKHLLQNKYDIVVSSTSFTFPLPTAAQAARHLNIPLVADLRDIAEQSPDDDYFLAIAPPPIIGKLILKLYKKKYIARRNRAIAQAQAVTTVSPWHVQILSRINSNTHLIYNGFDESVFYPEKIATSKFVIAYFGRIYNEKMRDPHLLLQALQVLKNKKLISSNNCAVQWYVEPAGKDIVFTLAERYDVADLMELHDFVKPQDLPQLMNRSSILLILCSTLAEKRFYGMMTTKFFEAMGCNRPVLCIPHPHDHLAELIEQNNCGLVGDELNEVCGFLEQHYTQWKAAGYVQGLLENEQRMQFSRLMGAQKLERIIEDLIEKK